MHAMENNQWKQITNSDQWKQISAQEALKYNNPGKWCKNNRLNESEALPRILSSLHKGSLEVVNSRNINEIIKYKVRVNPTTKKAVCSEIARYNIFGNVETREIKLVPVSPALPASSPTEDSSKTTTTSPKIIHLDLKSLDLKNLPNSLTNDRSLDSLAYINSINGALVNERDVRTLVKGMGEPNKPRYYFVLNRIDTPGFRLYTVNKDVIYRYGTYVLYIEQNQNPSSASIYITETKFSEKKMRETEARLLDTWISEFKEETTCIPYHNLLEGDDKVKDHHVVFNEIVSKSFRYGFQFQDRDRSSNFPVFAEVFYFNIKNKWNLPILSEDLHDPLEEASPYFFFRADPEEKGNIILITREQDGSLEELIFVIAFAADEQIILSLNELSEEGEASKQLFDMRILSQSYEKNGYTPMHALERHSKEKFS